MKAAFVLDASVAIAWFFADTEKNQAYARSVLRYIIEQDAIIVVPEHFHMEVAQFIMRKRRTPSAKFGKEAMEKAFLMLDKLALRTIAKKFTYRDIAEAARFFHVQAKDTPYITLAYDQSIPMATLDTGMQTACQNKKMDLLKFN